MTRKPRGLWKKNEEGTYLLPIDLYEDEENKLNYLTLAPILGCAKSIRKKTFDSASNGTGSRCSKYSIIHEIYLYRILKI